MTPGEGPGQFDGIPVDDYHRLPGISSSAIKEAMRSPLHYRAHVDGNGKEPTPAMELGTAIHCAVLEPDRFAAEYVLDADELRGKNRSQTKEYKAWRAGLPPGVTPLSPTDMARIAAICDSVHAHPWAAKLLSDGVAERSVWWEDPDTGLLCKCRPDYWLEDVRVAADLKSTTDARPDTFARKVVNMQYDVSAAFYMDGLGLDDFVWIVVEVEPPYATAVYRAPADALEHGRAFYRHALETIQQCEADQVWPAYSDDIQTLKMPPWAYV